MFQSDCGAMLRNVEAKYLTLPPIIYSIFKVRIPTSRSLARWVVYLTSATLGGMNGATSDKAMLPSLCWRRNYANAWVPAISNAMKCVNGFSNKTENYAAPKPVTSNITWSERYKWSRSPEAQNFRWWNPVQARWFVHLARKSVWKCTHEWQPTRFWQWEFFPYEDGVQDSVLHPKLILSMPVVNQWIKSRWLTCWSMRRSCYLKGSIRKWKKVVRQAVVSDVKRIRSFNENPVLNSLLY